MTNTQKQTFYVASIMASRKEQAYKSAIEYYFDNTEWDESLLEEHAGVNILEDGTEIFFISTTNLVRFGPLQSKTDIENGRVMCLFNQDIEALYL